MHNRHAEMRYVAAVSPTQLSPQRCEQLARFLRSIGLSAQHQSTPEAAAELHYINEALTHTSAGKAYNHERLEFLGDAVLRLAASEFLRAHQPKLSVGQQSTMRAQIVSDRWLAELGERCQIDSVLVIGAVAAGDQLGKATLRAEACEALIGALYLGWNSLTPVHQWLTPHWQHTLAQLERDPDLHNWKSALQEWSQGQLRGLPSYQCQEVSQRHGDPRRFHSQVSLGGDPLGEGWGGSRRQAEQEAARSALEALRPVPGS